MNIVKFIAARSGRIHIEGAMGETLCRPAQRTVSIDPAKAGIIGDTIPDIALVCNKCAHYARLGGIDINAHRRKPQRKTFQPVKPKPANFGSGDVYLQDGVKGNIIVRIGSSYYAFYVGRLMRNLIDVQEALSIDNGNGLDVRSLIPIANGADVCGELICSIGVVY